MHICLIPRCKHSHITKPSLSHIPSSQCVYHRITMPSLGLHIYPHHNAYTLALQCPHWGLIYTLTTMHIPSHHNALTGASYIPPPWCIYPRITMPSLEPHIYPHHDAYTLSLQCPHFCLIYSLTTMRIPSHYNTLTWASHIPSPRCVYPRITMLSLRPHIYPHHDAYTRALQCPHWGLIYTLTTMHIPSHYNALTGASHKPSPRCVCPHIYHYHDAFTSTLLHHHIYPHRGVYSLALQCPYMYSHHEAYALT